MSGFPGKHLIRKSPIISPDPEFGMPSDRSPIIVRDLPEKGQVSPSIPSLDCALNGQTRQESVPDSESPDEKSGVLFSRSASHEREFPVLHEDGTLRQ